MSKTEILNKLDDILDNARVNELLGRKKEEEKKCCDKLLWVFAIVGAVVAIAAIAYAMYRYFKLRKGLSASRSLPVSCTR